MNIFKREKVDEGQIVRINKDWLTLHLSPTDWGHDICILHRLVKGCQVLSREGNYAKVRIFWEGNETIEGWICNLIIDAI